MPIRLLFYFVFGLLLVASNAARANDVRASTCSKGSSCEVSGVASNQESGHGMVSRIKTDDGRCLNVSLPDDVSDGMEQDAQDRMTLRGDDLGYPDVAAVVEYQVDGRSVGKGECGEDFLFVESPSDVCVGEDAKCRQDGIFQRQAARQQNAQSQIGATEAERSRRSLTLLF